MELWLIRHGEALPACADTYDKEKKTANPGLTPRGFRQASALSERCRFVRFGKIVASDLDRAVETATILAAPGGLSVETDAGFREIDMGRLHSSAWSAFPAYYETWQKHETDLPYPGGECGGDVWTRCEKALERIRICGHGRAAVVCHAGTIRSILCGLLGLPQQKRFLFGDPIENTSITILRMGEGGTVLHTINDSSHLSGIG